MFYSCFLQGVDKVDAYLPDAVWYDYETVRISPVCFKMFHLKYISPSLHKRNDQWQIYCNDHNCLLANTVVEDKFIYL